LKEKAGQSDPPRFVHIDQHYARHGVERDDDASFGIFFAGACARDNVFDTMSRVS
jgi:hypothetical protein